MIAQEGKGDSLTVQCQKIINVFDGFWERNPAQVQIIIDLEVLF
jgi:hypothetical protein